MQLCLCTISYREKLLESALEAAQQGGFSAIELWGREPHISEEYDESRVRGVRRMVEERGLNLAVFGSYLRLGATQNRDDNVGLASTLHTAHGLRVPLVRVWASDVGSAQASESVWERTVEEAREACDRAAKMNALFAAEMHDDTLADTGASARELVERVGRANFRLNFQVGNFDHEDQLSRLQLVLPFVVHVHCQNFRPGGAGSGGKYIRCQLADGMVDYAPLVATLRGQGYAGCLAVEFAADDGDRKIISLRKDAQYLASL